MALLYLRTILLTIYAVLPAICGGQGITAPAHFYPYGAKVGDAKLQKTVGSDSFSVALIVFTFNTSINGEIFQ